MDITIKSGNQIDAIRIKETLKDLLFGHLSDQEKIDGVEELLIRMMSMHVAFDQGSSLTDAYTFVTRHIEKAS